MYVNSNCQQTLSELSGVNDMTVTEYNSDSDDNQVADVRNSIVSPN